MSDINTITITGRLGADPDLKYLTGGSAVLELRVAVGNRSKKGGEWTNETLWVGVKVFGARGESLVKILSKGSRVGVTGRLEVREYTTKDGELRKVIEIAAHDLALLSSAGDEQGARGGGGGNSVPRSSGSAPVRPAPKTQKSFDDAPMPGDDDDIIPF